MMLTADHRASHQERQALKEQERTKSRRRLEGVALLTELGYSRRDASRALHQADGDVDKAYAVSSQCVCVCVCVCVRVCVCVYYHGRGAKEGFAGASAPPRGGIAPP